MWIAPGAAGLQSKPFRRALMRAPWSVQAPFEFNVNFISPRADVWYLGRLRRLFNQIQNHFAPRCALAGDLLLSIATKVSKSALYRRQLLGVLAGADGA